MTLSLKHQPGQPLPADVLTADGSASVPTCTLDQLLVEAVIQCPEADAISGEFVSLTYADLLIRAQNIAVILRKKGIGPGHFVGVLMELSPATITAIISVILTGAAYVPLYGRTWNTPDGAADLRKASVSLVLCDRLASKSHWHPCAAVQKVVGHLLDVSRIEQETMPSSAEIQLPTIPASSPAARFISFAGSNEYVTVSHQSIVRLASSTSLLPFRNGETFLLQDDAARPALFEFWGSLLRGATLAIAPSGDFEAEHFAEWIRRKGISVLCLPVARVNEAIESAPSTFAKLHYLFIESDGTSAIAASRVEWLQRHYPHLQIVNTFGTPRTVGYATAYRVPPHYGTQGNLPAGRPLAGSQAQILNDNLEPVRTGEMGRLALQGDCVAADNRYDKDSPSHPGHGVYLTGQRARLRANGLLELHGQLETQLLSSSTSRQSVDVETMTSGHMHVREAAVIADIDHQGNPQLVAFFTLDNAQHSPAQAIEESLTSLLPPVAMPSAVRYVEEMPRGAAGDIDRLALQQHSKKECESQHRLDTEKQDILQYVRSLWSKILHQDFIGYEEEFFQAGGTQVQMIRLHAELNRKFPGAVSMGQLSVLTTIRRICEHLSAHLSDVRTFAS